MIAATLPMIAAFNLVCSGTMRTGPLGLAMPESDGTPFSITYRIDLDGRSWCSDACETTEPLADAFENVLILREQHHPAGSSVILVNPALGRFTDTRIEATPRRCAAGFASRRRSLGFRFVSHNID